MSDNQYADHLGCYGDKSIKTPYIDKLAKDGLIFKNAFCSAPSCSPARASMLTGQDIWSLGEAANLWSSFPKVKVYSQLMEASGYHIGIEGKGWGPGNESVTGWVQNPGGTRYDSFEEFFNEIEKGQPWMDSRKSDDVGRLATCYLLTQPGIIMCLHEVAIPGLTEARAHGLWTLTNNRRTV